MVLARLVYELQLSGEVTRIRSMAHEAVTTARELADPAILAYALMWAEPGLGWIDLGGRFARGAEMIRLAEPNHNAELAMMGRIRRVRAFLECSDLAAADAEAAELGRVANHARLLSYRWWLAVWKAQRAAMLGHFDHAERVTHEAFEIGKVFNREGAELHRDLQMMVVCRDQGRYDELDVFLQRQLGRQVHPSARCLMCLIDAERHRVEPAYRALAQLGGSDFSRLRDDNLWMVCAVMLAEVCSILDDAARAANLYERLLPFGERCVFSGVATAYHGNVARYLGQLATTLRRWPEAATHFETALRIDRRMGTQPWLARTQYDYARMLLARGGAGDRAGAEQLCAQAIETARTLGMRPLVEAITGSAASRQAVSC
jgi:tetratricopeptide (TPR) repeat protein